MIPSTFISLPGSFVDSWKIFLTIALLLKVSMVSSVAEDYYNPDYDEDESSLNPNNWGGIVPEPAKRHLGAVAASTNRAFHKNEMGNLPSGNGGLKYLRVVKSDHHSDFSKPNTRNPLEENHRDFSAVDPSDDILDQQELNPSSSSQFMDTEARIKQKRFLGALARGGWFPRQFRGVVDQQWDKRHIGSAARLGWMPNKMNRKNDASFKRNFGSLRKSKSGIPVRIFK